MVESSQRSKNCSSVCYDEWAMNNRYINRSNQGRISLARLKRKVKKRNLSQGQRNTFTLLIGDLVVQLCQHDKFRISHSLISHTVILSH